MQKWILTALLMAAPLAAAHRRSGSERHIAQVPVDSVEKHFAAGQAAYEAEDYQRALRHLDAVVQYYPQSEEAAEASFLKGLAFKELNEGVRANRCFDRHLQTTTDPSHFEEVFRHKLDLANGYRQGVRRPNGKRHAALHSSSTKRSSLQCQALIWQPKLCGERPTFYGTFASIVSQWRLCRT